MKVNVYRLCKKSLIAAVFLYAISACSTAAWKEIAEQAQRDTVLKQQAERAVLERQARTGIKEGPTHPSYRCEHYGSHTVCKPLSN